MKFINYLELPGRSNSRINLDDFEPVELGSVYDNVIEPLLANRDGVAKRNTGYTVRGTLGAKASIVELVDEGVSIVLIGICLHSRSSLKLMDRIEAETGMTDDDFGVPPSAPWCVIVRRVPDDVLPGWMDRWTRTLAASVLMHRDLIGDAADGSD